ncbi:MAG: sulfurtransferase [Gammaproteobacteria bacterium]
MSYSTLVTATALARHLDDPDWAVFDCRFQLTDTAAGRRAYDRGHIPGACYADLDRDLSGPVTADSGRHPLPDPAQLARRLGNWGVDERTQVVAYDDAGGAIAARLWWLLHWLGHEKAALLDGGLDQWQRDGHPVTDRVAARAPRTFAGRANPDGTVDTEALSAALAAGKCRLVDARGTERFRGEHEPIDPVAGHVPGAVNVPYSRNLDAHGCFRSAAELQALYAGALGTAPASEVVTMCGSGVTACHTLLALEIAGWEGARLYAGSWSEWIRDPARPVAGTAAPSD